MDNQALGKILENMPEKRVFAITEDYIGGHTASKAVQAHVKRTGKEWLGELLIPLGTTDYSSQMASVARAKPDILLGVIAATTTAYLNYCYDFGFTQSINVATVWPTFMNNLEVVKDKAIGVIAPMRYHFSSFNYVENIKFVNTYYSKFKKYPDFTEADSYIGMKFLFKAIEKAQSTETDAVIKAWEGLNITCLDGTIATMRKCDHQTMRTVYGGKFVKSKKYDIPDFEIMVTVPGEKAITPAEKTGCRFCI
jgi:branched-chain amino acid transport system substrate-binding protein